MGEYNKKKAGYEYLLAYKITAPCYDYTVVFCDRWIAKYSRTHDQMLQAARSGMMNIPEGYKLQSLKGYIKLTGVSRGSLEELNKDYASFARQNKLAIWTPEKCRREIREMGEIWEIIRKNPTLPDLPNFPDLPYEKEIAVNLMLTLTKQASYLIDKLIASLLAKHQQEGGLTEKLYRARKQYRGY